MSAVADAIKKVATGPHLSKDLSLEESREAMLEILSGKVDPMRKIWAYYWPCRKSPVSSH